MSGVSSHGPFGVATTVPVMSDREREQVRAAEVIASLCLATDLAMWFPFEHGLRATLTTMRLCDALGVDGDTASQTYYAALLLYVGCTTDADVQARIAHGSATLSGAHAKLFGSVLEGASTAFSVIPDPEAAWPTQVRQVAVGIPKGLRFRVTHFTGYCEVAQMIAKGVGLPPAISTLFFLVTERWDGRSHLRRAKGDEIPLPMRIAHVGADACYQRLMGDDGYVVETIGSRGGHAFDPAVTKAFVNNAPYVLREDDPETVWEEVLAAEPKPWRVLEAEEIDRALVTMGAFADLASPYLSGHARGVGDLAAAAAELMGMSETKVRKIRRAGYIHDVGRAAVPARVWDNAGPLSGDEWEKVRLHPYHTERVLARSSFLVPLGEIASAHHERLDGSGYHRAANAAALPPSARLLAAADAFHSKTEPRAYRPALSPVEAAANLASKAGRGLFDSEMVAAVVEAAGQTPPAIERPAGLTEREVEVIGLLARGGQAKQIARELKISPRTAERHIQNAYRKIGVSTRAAATLFAMEKGLVR